MSLVRRWTCSENETVIEVSDKRVQKKMDSLIFENRIVPKGAKIIFKMEWNSLQSVWRWKSYTHVQKDACRWSSWRRNSKKSGKSDEKGKIDREWTKMPLSVVYRDFQQVSKIGSTKGPKIDFRLIRVDFPSTGRGFFCDIFKMRFYAISLLAIALLFGNLTQLFKQF